VPGAQNGNSRKRQGPPGKNLPNLTQARQRPAENPRVPAGEPSTKCSARDKACRNAKERKSRKTSSLSAPLNSFNGLIAQFNQSLDLQPFAFDQKVILRGLDKNSNIAVADLPFANGESISIKTAAGEAALQQGYTLTPSPISVVAGGPITVTWTAPGGSSSFDWIGIFAVGSSDYEDLGWVYTNGATSGSTTFNAPYDSGYYEFRYFLNDGYTKVKTSNPVSVNALPFALERLDIANRIGAAGEDLASGNYNWSLPLLNLPGRAGLDLNLTLTYNSLVWTKSGSVIGFDTDVGYPSPGFRLGFPVIQILFRNDQVPTFSYLLIMPSGQRVELRQTALNTYESVDSSYLYLTVNPSAQTMTLYTANGTQLKFEPKADSYKCTQIKDRNGNFIAVTYTDFGGISTITDTLARVINFNYDAYNHLLSITQAWETGTHTWATFSYGNQTIQTNFSGGLTVSGPLNFTTIPVLTRVNLDDGSRYDFTHTRWGQVRVIERFGGDGTPRYSIVYNLPTTTNPAQNDCPRFTQRTDNVDGWSASGAIHTFAWNQTDGNGTFGRVTAPDNTVFKEYYAQSGWQRGLVARTETLAGLELKKWTTANYTQDNTSVGYPLNPRVLETNVYDSANNRRRITIDYHPSYGLPSNVYEYDGNGTTVLRRTYTSYKLTGDYTSRRIIGLPLERSLYDGAGVLHSKVTHEYDERGSDLGGCSWEFLANQGPPVQHDAANYGGCFQWRGNLTSVTRWDVNTSTNLSNAVTHRTGYNTSGSVVLRRDPSPNIHQVNLSYTDSFSDNQNRDAFAYPTTITDADGHASTIKYRFDIGAVTRTQNPKGAATTRTYDNAGRILQITNLFNNAYTRYVYGASLTHVMTHTTIQDGQGEFYSIAVLDGFDQVWATASEHPGSAGGYKAQYFYRDSMRRLQEQSNPTEITANWVHTGDDSAGFSYTSFAYDWQGRATATLNPDQTSRFVNHDGCGCAGGQVAEFTDEVGRKRDVTYDALGRPWRTRTYNSGGSGGVNVYSTVVDVYNTRDQLESSTISGAAGEQVVEVDNDYDGHGRLWRRKRAIESSHTIFSYNPDDTVQTMADARGVLATYGYNKRHLTTSVSYSGGGIAPASAPVTYEYDELGNRKKMIDGLGHVDYSYDPIGRMQSETRVFANLSSYNTSNFLSHNGVVSSYPLTHEYNLAGQLTKIVDPWHAANPAQGSVIYQRDKAGQVIAVEANGYGNFDSINNNNTAISPLVSGIKYRAWGALKEFNTNTDTSISAHAYQYNERLLPTYLKQGNRITTQTYYADGLLQDVADQYRPAFNRHFEYDHAGRLSLAKAGNDPDWTKNPFFFKYEYNVFGDTTKRKGQTTPVVIPAHYWSESLPEFTTNWTNHRDDTLQQNGLYNALGSLGAESAMNQAGLLARFDKPTGSNYLRDRYHYDGDGERGYMNQYYHLGDPHTPPPDNPAYDNRDNYYYLRSTPLGGVIIAEFSVRSNLQNQLVQTSYKTRVYFNGDDIACNTYNRDYLNSGPARFLTWNYRNPFTGSVYSHNYRKLSPNGSPLVDSKADNTTDPVGATVAATDPALSTPPPAENLELDPSAVSGDIHDYRSSCKIDGAPTPCAEVLHRINHNPGLFTISRINFSKFFIFPQSFGIGESVGVAPRLYPIVPQSSRSKKSSCGHFVDNVVTLTELHLERGKKTVEALGAQFLTLAAIAESRGRTQKFDGFQEIYIGKETDQVGQKWAVYQHVYGFIGASLIGNSKLPQLIIDRTGVQTGLELVNKQLQEDQDQRDHPEKYPEKDQQGIEANQEVADDLAGIAASNLIRSRISSPGLLSAPQLRQQLFGLFCDR
jgi:hypothetical protein